MQSKELITFLETTPEAEVDLSFSGGAPQRINATARRDNGHIVLLAMPSWPNTELEAQLALVKDRANSQGSQTTWERMFVRHSSNRWVCLAHTRYFVDCRECRAEVDPGWHWGLVDANWFCNQHNIKECTDSVCVTFPKVEA